MDLFKAVILLILRNESKNNHPAPNIEGLNQNFRSEDLNTVIVGALVSQ